MRLCEKKQQRQRRLWVKRTDLSGNILFLLKGAPTTFWFSLSFEITVWLFQINLTCPLPSPSSNALVFLASKGVVQRSRESFISRGCCALPCFLLLAWNRDEEHPVKSTQPPRLLHAISRDIIDNLHSITDTCALSGWFRV